MYNYEHAYRWYRMIDLALYGRKKRIGGNYIGKTRKSTLLIFLVLNNL